MYRHVALEPHGSFHFELGGVLASRLGYPAELVACIPTGAVESFAGVGYLLDLADLKPGEDVVDLGSGAGMDALLAARLVAPAGRVVGVDFTREQLDKARRLAGEAGLANVEFREGRIEALPMANESQDCVISNGVLNLSPDKDRVFAEVARVLRPGGRLALADIVTERQLTEAIVCNVDLWASCVGGAAQQDSYLAAIEAAGLTVTCVRDNDYAFVSPRALSATRGYGVKSISLLATKPAL
jgi:arsenite methyltransferase